MAAVVRGYHQSRTQQIDQGWYFCCESVKGFPRNGCACIREGDFLDAIAKEPVRTADSGGWL